MNYTALSRAARAAAPGYNDEAKADWRRHSLALARSISKTLGGGKVRRCEGGIAVAGEAIVQTDKVYVCIHANGFSQPGGYYRKASPADPYGTRSPNIWFALPRDRRDHDALLGRIRAHAEYL